MDRTLRSAQHFDLRDVEQRGRHADTGEIDAVDQEPDRRIGRALPLVVLTDAAQLEVSRRDVPDAQFRFGTRPSTSCRCCTPTPWICSAPTTLTLMGADNAVSRRRLAVMTTSCSGSCNGVCSCGGGPACGRPGPDGAAACAVARPNAVAATHSTRALAAGNGNGNANAQ
nr:hypothetical protein [Microcystis aeruginosa]